MKTKYIVGVMLLTTSLFTVSCSDDDYTIATESILSQVSTGDASVTAVSATTQGTVLDLTKSEASSYSVGVIYSTNQDPTTSGKKVVGSLATDGTVSSSITGLTKNVTYYYATYVTLQNTVTKYGDVKSFVTTDANIATAGATNISSVSATVGGTCTVTPDIITVGGSTTDYGVKIATTETDVKNGREYAVTDSSKNFTQVVDGLIPGRTYYYTTYFKISDGYQYGETKSFTTTKKDMEYVDLGLSVMWAKYNIGAEKETQQGGLYGWGDATGLNTSTTLTDYTPASDIVGTANDIAYSASAGIDGNAEQKSMLPTTTQVEELISKTTHTWTAVDGVSGYKFTAKNGNSIFIPAVGYREGETISGATVIGEYWTGNINSISTDYGTTLNMQESAMVEGMSKRSLGLAVRSVRAYEKATTLDVDNSKIKVGDLENNGRIRIEIYNAYGSTKDDPGINTNLLKFSKNMVIKFKLSGVTNNLKTDAAGSYTAGLQYADNSWDPSLWSDFNQKYDAKVTEDGEYTVWMETSSSAEGAAVFCIDINGLDNDLVDNTKVKAEIESISFDVDNINYYVDNSKVLFNNKDGNGTDGRIEIYNEYGDTKKLGADYSDLSFNSYMIVDFTISGIDGNLIDGASKSYKTELSYAASGWSPAYWGGTTAAAAKVTGDGSYEVWAPISGNASGAVVWTIELYNLWKDLKDNTKVKATIDKVIIPGKK